MAGVSEAISHPLAIRVTGVVVFFLLLSLLLWRRGHRN
jgi:hypothetical protein